MTRTKPAQRISAHDAAALVRSGDWLDYGAVLGQPDAFDKALAERVGELCNVNIRGCLSVRPRAVVEADPGREHFNYFNWHFGGYDRKHGDAGLQNYIPCNLGEISDYYRRFIDPPDLMVVKTCPMDANGYFNLSAANLWHRAVASRAKVVIVEENSALPYVHGIDNGLHISEVDYIIEGDGQPPTELPNPAPTDADRAVAQADRLRDRGRRLSSDRHRRHAQRGVLVVAGEWCAQPRRSHRDAHRRDHRPLQGRHRHRLREDAASRQDRVQLRPGFAVALRDDRRQPGHLLPSRSSRRTCPHIIMQNDRMTAINNTTQMDLQGQAASESERSPPHQWHRRSTAVHPRCLCVEGRQVVHLHVVDLRTRRCSARAASC